MINIKESILRSASASKMAYLARHVNSSIINFDKTHIYDKRTRTSLYVFKTGVSSKVIAFRGSTHVKDILEYLECCQTAFSFSRYKMKVHSGVLDKFASIENELTHILCNDDTSDKLKYKNEISDKPNYKTNINTPISNLTFCGHSLGGALATIAAAYYGMMFHKNYKINCHTFGTPKVGNKDFNVIFNDHISESYHFINKNDIVPNFPLYHPEYTLKYANVIRFDEKYDMVTAHDLDTYIENVRKYVYLMKMPKNIY